MVWRYLAPVLMGTGLWAVLLAAAALLDTRLIARPDVWAVDLRHLRAADAHALERAFEKAGFAWPPLAQVPPLAVAALPPGLDELDVQQKKTLFFRALLPVVLAENQRIRAQRAFLLEGFRHGLPPAGSARRDAMQALAEAYRVNGDLADPAVQRRLLRRVDEVPVALVLAQAANESGWGTSRFAREGNSLFGQWTYQEGAGLVPEGRPEGARYAVRAFPDLRSSVRSYLHNLNIGHAYQEFRAMRAAMRAAGEPLDPLQLAAGLIRYSERGEAYVEELRAMIRGNELTALDNLTLAHR